LASLRSGTGKRRQGVDQGEYVFANFGRWQIFFPPTGVYAEPHDVHLLRVGLNVKF
jgi:hypothetical protein